MRIIIGLSIAMLSLAGPSSSQLVGSAEAAPIQLDIERVVHLALDDNAALRAEMARRDEVLGAVEEVAADAWPQLDLVSSWSRSRNPALLNSPDFADFVGQFPGFEPREQELWSLALEVNQPIYTGGKVRAAIDLAELVVDITDARILAAKLDAASAAAESYYRLLAARAAIDTIESQQLARREALSVVEARLELGDATRLEQLRAVASLEAIAPRLAGFEGAMRVEASRLRALLGIDAQRPVVAEHSDGDGPQLPDPLPTLGQLIAIAEARRPELRDLVLQLAALDRQRTVAVAEGRPQVDLSGAYGRQARLVDDLSDRLFDDWRVTLGLEWNLFDGGRRRGQLAQLDSRGEQLRWQLEDQRRQIVLEIDRAGAELATARERLRAARITTEAAGEAVRVARESYQLGVALQADLLDAQDLSVKSQLEVDDATFSTLIQSVRLRRAIGLLPTADWPSEIP